MRALVIYESMYGHTRAIAEAVARGLWARGRAQVRTVAVSEVHPKELRGLDLLVLGAPTHHWNLSDHRSRRLAAQAASRWGSGLRLQQGATRPGMREWLSHAKLHGVPVACFDTRRKVPDAPNGSAATAIARRMRHTGSRLLVPPAGFAVTESNHLVDGELSRAQEWGAQLADVLTRRKGTARR